MFTEPKYKFYIPKQIESKQKFGSSSETLKHIKFEKTESNQTECLNRMRKPMENGKYEIDHEIYLI